MGTCPGIDPRIRIPGSRRTRNPGRSSVGGRDKSEGCVRGRKIKGCKLTPTPQTVPHSPSICRTQRQRGHRAKRRGRVSGVSPAGKDGQSRQRIGYRAMTIVRVKSIASCRCGIGGPDPTRFAARYHSGNLPRKLSEVAGRAGAGAVIPEKV